jgi:hypothetical protein
MCFIGALATLLQAAPASAQLFWDWGGKEDVASSGKEVVRFSTQFQPGHIVVSFATGGCTTFMHPVRQSAIRSQFHVRRIAGKARPQ